MLPQSCTSSARRATPENLQLLRQIEFLKSKGASLDGYEASLSGPVHPHSTGNKFNLKVWAPSSRYRTQGYVCVYSVHV